MNFFQFFKKISLLLLCTIIQANQKLPIISQTDKIIVDILISMEEVINEYQNITKLIQENTETFPFLSQLEEKYQKLENISNIRLLSLQEKYPQNRIQNSIFLNKKYELFHKNKGLLLLAQQYKQLFSKLLEGYLSQLGQWYQKESGWFITGYKKIDCISSYQNKNIPITPNEQAILMHILEQALQCNFQTLVVILLTDNQGQVKFFNIDQIIQAIKQIPISKSYSMTAIINGVSVVIVLSIFAYFIWKYMSEQASPLYNQIKNFTKKISPFPTEENPLEKILKIDPSRLNKIQEQLEQTHPITHTKTLALADEFLTYKKTYGSNVEKNFYQNMTPEQLVDRLFLKRPLMFVNGSDDYLLRSGERGQGGFETIGTDQQTGKLILHDYLSYDEIQLSALFGVSCPTYFINDGARDNQAKIEKPGTYQEDGVYIGLVGARFEKPGYMEYAHMVITPEQNTKEHGYGKNNQSTSTLRLWEKLYNTKFVTYEEAKSDTSGRFLKLTNSDKYFDKQVYKDRIKLVIEPYLQQANELGKQANKQVYCSVTGLGLGVWKLTKEQTQLMYDVYNEVLTKNNLSHISDIDFSYFPEKFIPSQDIKKKKITIHNSHRNVAEKLLDQDKDKLLVGMFAWDGNSYVGNEYWNGALSASGDPAAASCSAVAILANPLINPNLSSKNLKTFGNN